MEKALQRRHFINERLCPVNVCFILCSLMLLLSAGQVLSKDIVYKMAGKISAVEPTENTVVIEVPMKDGEFFTVGGPLAPDAIVRKADHSAALADFSPGEEVTVKWKSIDTGHLILMLEK